MAAWAAATLPAAISDRERGGASVGTISHTSHYSLYEEVGRLKCVR